jgi:glyoxylase-like metal-dependent hydrolase (beta-lactamase superfamily II)
MGQDRIIQATVLERSCGVLGKDWMRIAPALNGLERLKARFHGYAYDWQRFGEAERELLEGTEIVPSTDSYDGDHGALDLGGKQVEFHTFGTAHSPGDQIILLPKEKILFAGDLIEERMFPIVPFLPPTITKSDIDVAKWVQALMYIQQIEPSIIVPGHGSLGQAEISRSLCVYFTDVQERVRKSAETQNLDALVDDDRGPFEKAAGQYAVSPTNPAFIKEYRDALQAFIAKHRSDADPDLIQDYEQQLERLGGANSS